jgi:Na+/melibiose symporter-like transporter
MFEVAYQSYLPALVARDQLVEANSKLQTTAAAAGTAGPAIAGALIGILTAPYAVIVDAASFAVSTAFVVGIRAREDDPRRSNSDAPKPRLATELKEGLAWVMHHPHLKWIALCTGSLNFFDGIITGINLLYMQRELGLSAVSVGLTGASFGIGSMLAALTSSRLQRGLGLGRAMLWGAILCGVGALAYPLAPAGDAALPVLLTGCAVMGYGAMAYNIAQVSYRQAITPMRLLGRMNASMRWLVWGTIPLGTLAGGALASAVSMHAALWVGAVGGLFGFLPVALSSVRSIVEMPAATADIA